MHLTLTETSRDILIQALTSCLERHWLLLMETGEAEQCDVTQMKVDVVEATIRELRKL